MTPPPESRKGARGDCGCLPRPDDPQPPTEPRAAATYVLRYEDRWFGLEKCVTFAAEDVVAALVMMEREPIGRWAELAREDEVICRRGHEPDGAVDYWVVD